MVDSKSRLTRRNFLLAAGAGGAATAVAVVAGKPSQPQPRTPADAKRATKGYSVSEHINNYYRTTKV